MDKIRMEIRTKKGDDWLIHLAVALKSKGQLSQVVRDGLRLIFDLRAGQVEVLLELFPFLKAQLGAFVQDIVQDIVLDKPAKSLSVASFAMPTFDDKDTLVITRDERTGEDSNMNFLNAAFGMVHSEVKQ